MENHRNLIIGAVVVVLALGAIYAHRYYMGNSKDSVKIQSSFERSSTETQDTAGDKIKAKYGAPTPG